MTQGPMIEITGCTFVGIPAGQSALTVIDNNALTVASAHIRVGEVTLSQEDFSVLLDLVHALDRLPDDSDLKQALVAVRAARRLDK